jgi:hypothetical protein
MVLASWQGRVERLDFVNGTALPPIGQASASPGLTHWSVEVDTDNEVAAVEISFWDYVDGRLHARYALEGGPCLWETAVSCFAVPCELDVITPIFDYYDADGLHLGSWR